MARGKAARELTSVIKNIISPKDVTERLKNRPKKNKPSGPKADPQNVARLKSAAKKAKKSTPKSDGKAKRKYNMDAKQFEPNKPQAAGMVKRDSRLKSKKAKLNEKFDGLTKGEKRGEQLKGRESEFYSIFKDRGMTEMKAGGYMKKKMAGGGSLKMVEKNGKKVPFYAADGVGKMAKGGKVSKSMGEDRTSVPAEYSAKAQSKKPVKKKMGGGSIGGKRKLTKGKKEGEKVYTRPDYITGKERVQVKSDVKGGRGKTNPSRVKPTASKGQIHSAANKEKIDKAAKAANKRSKKANKYNPTKEEMFGSETKRPSNFGEIRKRQRQDKGFETVSLKHGGKTVSGNDGNSIVAACYD